MHSRQQCYLDERDLGGEIHVVVFVECFCVSVCDVGFAVWFCSPGRGQLAWLEGISQTSHWCRGQVLVELKYWELGCLGGMESGLLGRGGFSSTVCGGGSRMKEESGGSWGCCEGFVRVLYGCVCR